VIEQGSVAQSIRSFPRGKLVFDQPLELPVSGKLWLEESTKEELLGKWLRIVREERLNIVEGRRFVALERLDAGFRIDSQGSDDGAKHESRALKVLLAIGVRGSPRRLAIALDATTESKVFYHLADARSFAEQRVLVVGLGDVAMETAIALAHQPGTTVTVCYRGEGFRRGKTRNVAELQRLVRAERVTLWFGSQPTRIGAADVELTTPRGPVVLPNDAVFVMIGSIAPTDLLTRAGVGSSEHTSEAREEAPAEAHEETPPSSDEAPDTIVEP
jgi:thioredoxin reductase